MIILTIKIVSTFWRRWELQQLECYIWDLLDFWQYSFFFTYLVAHCHSLCDKKNIECGKKSYKIQLYLPFELGFTCIEQSQNEDFSHPCDLYFLVTTSAFNALRTQPMNK